jgi:hypothetical protein
LDLKQSVQIPGTKIKVPVIEVVAAGAAVIGAYVLLSGKNGQQPDVSTAATDTSSDNQDTVTQAYTGAIEDISNRLAALESAPQQSIPGGSPSGSGSGTSDMGANTGAPSVADIPVADVTATQVEIHESINPLAMVTQGSQAGSFAVEMPAVSAKAPVSPIAPPSPPSAPAKVAQTVRSATSGSQPKTSAKPAPALPLTKIVPVAGASSRAGAYQLGGGK